MFEKNLQIGYLLDFYGDILPERKRSVMDMYYNEDLSLAEIAEQIGFEIVNGTVVAYMDDDGTAVTPKRARKEGFPCA